MKHPRKLTPEVRADVIAWYLARQALGTSRDKARQHKVCHHTIYALIEEARQEGLIPPVNPLRSIHE